MTVRLTLRLPLPEHTVMTDAATRRLVGGRCPVGGVPAVITAARLVVCLGAVSAVDVDLDVEALPEVLGGPRWTFADGDLTYSLSHLIPRVLPVAQRPGGQAQGDRGQPDQHAQRHPRPVGEGDPEGQRAGQDQDGQRRTGEDQAEQEQAE